MKTILFQTKPDDSPSFQITVLPKDFTLPGDTPPSGRTPFADLMLHPDKLEAALKIARRENDAFSAARNHCAQRSTESATTESRASQRPAGFKTVEFHLAAPTAKSVKLAADFTNWEKFPIDMVKSVDGIWSIFIPLSPGNYSYRYIVDGMWCDDPEAVLFESNPSGKGNAVRNVI